MWKMRNSIEVMCIIFMLALSSSANLPSRSPKLADVEEDAILTVPQLITKYGYPVETHSKIITKDGYILTLHRIPHARNSSYSPGKPIVYIQSGLVSNSGEPVLAGPDNAIAYAFADSGYDVWLGNTRGSRYSTEHVSLDRNNNQYWDYSFSDIGYYDIPAMIDYILKTTGQEKLYYIGHSRGTTSFYVMCSTKPEYNNKIRAMASLAPVAYTIYFPNPFFRIFASNGMKIQKVLGLLGLNKYITDNVLLSRISYVFCKPNTPTAIICDLMIKLAVGFDNKFNTSLIPVLTGHIPDGFAVKEVAHYAQLYRSGKFRDYDYGIFRNMLKYNSFEPPNYNLSKVSAPVALYCSTNDWDSSVIDAQRIYKELGNPIVIDMLSDGPNHFSYFNGINMKTYLYDKIIEVFQNY